MKYPTVYDYKMCKNCFDVMRDPEIDYHPHLMIFHCAKHQEKVEQEIIDWVDSLCERCQPKVDFVEDLEEGNYWELSNPCVECDADEGEDYEL